MTDPELIAFAAEFRRGLLGRKKSTGMCWVVCAPLSVILQMHGIENDLTEGTFIGNHHFYLKLRDGRVLDPTVDQFAPSGKPKVYLGKCGRLYRAKRNWSKRKIPTVSQLEDIGGSVKSIK